GGWGSVAGRLPILVERDQRHDRGVDEALARMLEIDGHALADRRLHLTYAPVGLAGVPDAGTWYEPVAQTFSSRSCCQDRPWASLYAAARPRARGASRRRTS